MSPEEFKRKLTAILSADVEGYSRLMGEDEDATIRTLTTYRELMSTLINKHRGRVVDSPGDNLLAEFGSVVDAVRCAVEIQEELRVRNAEPSEPELIAWVLSFGYEARLIKPDWLVDDIWERIERMGESYTGDI